MTLIHAFARFGIAFIWLWQGLVPKLMFANVDEKAMVSGSGLPAGLVPAFGVLEMVFAAITLCAWRWRPFFVYEHRRHADSALRSRGQIAVTILSLPSIPLHSTSEWFCSRSSVTSRRSTFLQPHVAFGAHLPEAV